MQLKSFFQNEIVNFPHLILMSHLSPITLIKVLFFFLALLVAFSSALKYTYFFFMHNLFFVFNILIAVYTPRV